MRIAVDVGGTFTDVVVLDEQTGALHFDKVETIPSDPCAGVVNGIEKTGSDLSGVDIFVHGTTLGLNALLTRSGAELAIITTRGFRDVYLLGRTDRDPLYSLKYRKPEPLVPSFLYGWPALQSIDAIYNAIGKAKPEAVPACSGCDIPNVYWWGYREKTGEPWAHGGGMPCGGGAHVRGDGTTMYHVSLAQSRISPLELAETKFPLIYNKFELARDSGGAGKNRGACGIDISYHVTEECFGTAPIERQKTPPWGLEGGSEARPNSMTVYRPGEAPEKIGKATGLKFPKGTVVDLAIAGGGGYGPPSERALERVHEDIADGYISEAYAREHYPQSISDKQAA